MNGTATALCAAISIENSDTAPEWLHLLPAGEARTVDGRGPFRLTDPAAVVAASIPAGGKLVLDENHSTDLAAPRGLPAPARAWIVELEARADGIWGRPEWTDVALQSRVWRDYRGISPAIRHAKDGTVLGIARASLTNLPNITGLTSLHAQENDDMDFRAALLEALSLGSEADDAAILASITALKGGGVALNAALKPIAAAVGVAEDADAATVLAGVEQLKGGSDDRVVALQSELSTITTRLNTVTEQQSRDKATVFVDAAIGAGRVGLKPVRDEYISMHMSEPARAEKLINAMPILKPNHTSIVAEVAPEGTPDSPALLAQKAVAYQRKMAADGISLNMAQAVRAVQEGKAA